MPKPARRVTVQNVKSVHLGLHRPPPPKATGETSWEKGINKAKERRKMKNMNKIGEPLPPVIPSKEEENGMKRAKPRTNTCVLERLHASPSTDIKQDIECYERDQKKAKPKKPKRWDRQQNFIDEDKRDRKPRRRSESSESDSSSSSSSSSSLSSAESISSESSGRKTPKGYRSNRNGSSQRRSSSEDEDYRRTRRLENRAMGITTKKPKTDNRASSKKKRQRKASSSSSSSSSSESSSDSDRSSRSEKKRIKLQKQLKQVEAALKAKRGSTRDRPRKK